MFNEQLFKEMLADCPNINDDFGFYDLVGAHTGNISSRDGILYWFVLMWERIPKAYLYKTYKDMLTNIQDIRGHGYYSDFFQPWSRSEKSIPKWNPMLTKKYASKEEI